LKEREQLLAMLRGLDAELSVLRNDHRVLVDTIARKETERAKLQIQVQDLRGQR